MAPVETVIQHKRVARRRRPCLELNVAMLRFFGFWPESGDEVRNFSLDWRYLFPRVQLVRMVYSLVFQAINVYLVWGDLARVVEYFTMILLYSMTLSKCVTLFGHREKLLKMVTGLRSLNTSKMICSTFLITSAKKTEKLSHNFTKCFLFFMVPAFALNAIFLIIQGVASGEMPFRYWLPYNYETKIVYELTLTITTVAMIFDLCIILTSDLIFIGLTIHINGQFKILNHKLRNIRHSVERIRSPPQVAPDLLHLNSPNGPLAVAQITGAQVTGAQITGAQVTGAQVTKDTTARDDEPKKNDNSWDDTVVNKIERKNIRFQLDGDDIGPEVTTPKRRNNNAINDDMEDCLRNCVQHHQILIGFNHDLGNVFKFMLINQIVTNLACGIVALYITTLAKSMDFKVVVSLFLSLASYLETLLFCWFCNIITEESQNVLHSVYGCDWFGASESFKRSIRIIISRSNRPLIVRAAGLPLSMRTFRTIYKAAYYIHMIATRIFHGVKISRKS